MKNATNVVRFTVQSYGDSFNDLLKILQVQKCISLFVNGKRYFLFAIKGRIYYICEFSFSLILCSLVFITIFSARKLTERFKLNPKVVTLIKKLRGGKMLHYEKDLQKEINDPANYSLLPNSYLDLTSQEKLIKDMIKKCLKPNRIYKIPNHSLLKLINEMVSFDKQDRVKIISYGLFVLALVVSTNPVNTIVYTGISNVLSNLVNPFLVINLPIISFVFTAATFAFQVDLNVNLSTLGFKFLYML